MFKINDNYLRLPGSYLFSTIGKKVNAYAAANPDKKIIRLGIGDVTQPWFRRSSRRFTERWMKWGQRRHLRVTHRSWAMNF